MPATTRIIPTGSYNHVGFDYLSPRTAASPITILTAGTSGTAYAAFDGASLAVQTDKVNEYTPAAGVNIDGVLLKDGGATFLTALPIASGGTAATSASAARTSLGAAASGANSDITSLTGITFASTYTPTYGGGGSLAWTPTPTTRLATYLVIGKICYFTIDFTGTISGGTGNFFTATLPFTAATSGGDYWGGGLIINNSVNTLGAWSIASAATTVTIYKADIGATNFPAGTSGARVTGFYKTV